MTKPVCVSCRRFFHVKKNGYAFVEAMPREGSPEPGDIEPDRWEPYKLWMGDLWECKGCGEQIVSGTGRTPLAEHFQKDFEQQREAYNAELQVNDS